MDPLTLLLADSRFPSGSYAHSLGLEQAVNDGLRDVPAFIRARQRHVAHADARFAVEASRGHVFEQEWYMRTPSPALRDAARRTGSQLLRSASAIWDVPVTKTPRPLALGIVAGAAGIADEDTALLALYDDSATVASAALKLVPLDPAVTARWLADLAPDMARAAARIAADGGPLPAPAAVAIELNAPIHLEQRERLFAS